MLVILISSIIVGLLIGLSFQNRKLSAANQEIEKIASFKEHFFLNLSHEVRTPLTMILAPVSVLLSSKNWAWEQIKKQLETVRHHGHYLKRLIDQMLDFQKMELGKYRLNVSEGDIAQLVHDTSELFRFLAEEHRIDYQIEINPSAIPGWFDPEKIQIILMNLIGNAFKYTRDEGKIRIHLQFDPLSQDSNDNWISIRFEDNGVGIPANRLENIFDRFYHVEHPGKLFYDSIGIGLEFTKEIIELHKGKISVESEFGKGSVFNVHLPISKEHFSPDECVLEQTKIISTQLAQEKIEEIKEERARLHSDEKTDKTPGGLHAETSRQKVLIVEDHPDMRDLLRQILEKNYDILLAENGRQGIRQALAEVPDLVISDVMMPEMDGIEMTTNLKSNTITSHIPVILLTVKSETEHRISGFETGADAYITKPFVLEELEVRIRKLIEGRELLKKRFSQDVDINLKEVTANKLDETFLEKLITLIEENISEPDFNVDQLCADLCMSRSQAYKKVKSISGFAINEFIIQIKLKRAAKMLIESSMNISEIAYYLGFFDHSHMNRHFRNAFNCSPKEYRMKHTA
jgi:DNA-binding response OmpR family regulator/nitrogen-specific signal transduction histidine kinase